MAVMDPIQQETTGGHTGQEASASQQPSRQAEAKRLFLAFWPDEDLARRLTHIMGTVPPSPFRTAAVQERDFHVTLHFLGAVAGQSERALVASLARATGAWHSFDLESTTIALLPSAARPHSLILDMQGIPRSTALEVHRRCADLLSALSLPVESRPWRPHITLAKIRSDSGHPERRRESMAADSESGIARQGSSGSRPASAWPQVSKFRMHVHSLHLVESVLGRSGARYDILESFALRA